MAIKLNNQSVRVSCSCGALLNIHIYDWSQDAPEVYETSDSRMGPQICHRFSVEDIECCQCHATVSAQIEVWENPPGIKEFTGRTDNVDADDAESAINVEGE